MDFLNVLFVLSVVILVFYLINCINNKVSYISSIKEEWYSSTQKYNQLFTFASILKEEKDQLEIDNNDSIRFIDSCLTSLNAMSIQLDEFKDYKEIINSMSVFERLEYLDQEKCKLRKLCKVRRYCTEDFEKEICRYQTELELNQNSLSLLDNQVGIYSIKRMESLKNDCFDLKQEREKVFNTFKLYSQGALELLLPNNDDEDNFAIQLMKAMADANIDELSPMPLTQGSLELINQEICYHYINECYVKWVELKLDIQEFNSLVNCKCGSNLEQSIALFKKEFERLSNLKKDKDDEIQLKSSPKKEKEELTKGSLFKNKAESATKKHEAKVMGSKKSIPTFKTGLNKSVNNKSTTATTSSPIKNEHKKLEKTSKLSFQNERNVKDVNKSNSESSPTTSPIKKDVKRTETSSTKSPTKSSSPLTSPIKRDIKEIKNQNMVHQQKIQQLRTIIQNIKKSK